MSRRAGFSRHDHGGSTALRWAGRAVIPVVVVVVGIVVMVGGNESDPPPSSETVPTSEFVAPDGARTLGSVTVDGEASGCRLSQCRQVTVACPDTTPITALVAVEPAIGDPRGVVLMYSGGEGVSFWSNARRRASLVEPWTTAGLSVVEVAWSGRGWAEAPPGIANGFAVQSCRPATMTRWVHETEFAPLGIDGETGVCGFCVGGNSGGSSQTMFGLTHYGLADLVDAVVITAGPPHSFIARGCSGGAGDAALAYRPDAEVLIDLAYGGSPGPCAGHDDPGTWEADGIGTGGSDYGFPGTRVVIVLGGDDVSGATDQAQLLADRLRAAGTVVDVHVVPGEGHKVEESDTAVDLVRDAVLTTRP